jgi:hypothetical protein
MIYRPFRFFAIPGIVFFGFGLLISFRFLYFYFSRPTSGHIQSLILAALLLGIGSFLLIVGLLADLISINRKLLEKARLARAKNRGEARKEQYRMVK